MAAGLGLSQDRSGLGFQRRTAVSGEQGKARRLHVLPPLEGWYSSGDKVSQRPCPSHLHSASQDLRPSESSPYGRWTVSSRSAAGTFSSVQYHAAVSPGRPCRLPPLRTVLGGIGRRLRADPAGPGAQTTRQAVVIDGAKAMTLVHESLGILPLLRRCCPGGRYWGHRHLDHESVSMEHLSESEEGGGGAARHPYVSPLAAVLNYNTGRINHHTLQQRSQLPVPIFQLLQAQAIQVCKIHVA